MAEQRANGFIKSDLGERNLLSAAREATSSPASDAVVAAQRAGSTWAELVSQDYNNLPDENFNSSAWRARLFRPAHNSQRAKVSSV